MTHRQLLSWPPVQSMHSGIKVSTGKLKVGTAKLMGSELKMAAEHGTDQKQDNSDLIEAASEAASKENASKEAEAASAPMAKPKKQKKKATQEKLLAAVESELAQVDDDVVVESVAVDTAGMNQSQLRQLVEEQSPELVSLLDEFIEQLTTLRQSTEAREGYM